MLSKSNKHGQIALLVDYGIPEFPVAQYGLAVL